MIMNNEILTSYTWKALCVACIASVVCLFVHFYKFFRSPAKQSMATRNLTVYCVFLMLIYLSIFCERRPEPKFKEPNQTVPGYLNTYTYNIVLQYLLMTSVFYKFVIAVELCWSFRKIALYLQPPDTGSQYRIFFIYCVSGISIPLLYVTIRLKYFYDEDDRQLEFMATHYELDFIRISRLIPIFGAFWYIRAASMNKTELWTRFSLHICLLISLGGFSAILSGAQLVSFVIMRDDKSNTEDFAMRVHFIIQMIGIVLEGLVIGVFFTFKNDTFQSNMTK